MTTNKFLNQELTLSVKKTNYGYYRLIVDALEDRYTSLTNDKVLISIDSTGDNITTHQDYIDNAVKYVLDCNEINY